MPIVREDVKLVVRKDVKLVYKVSQYIGYTVGYSTYPDSYSTLGKV